MISILGIIFLCLLLVVPILLIDYFVGNDFLKSFLGGHSISLMGTLLGLNFIIVVFMMQSMTAIEFKIKKKIFDKTKKEIKHNTFFMLVLFVLHFFVLVLTPKVSHDTSQIYQSLIFFCKAINLILFSLSFYCIYEVVVAAFTISKIAVPDQDHDSQENNSSGAVGKVD